MAEKRNESFTVTDRRLFTADGELRKESSEEQEVVVSKPAAVSESADQKASAADPGTSAAETRNGGRLGMVPGSLHRPGQGVVPRNLRSERHCTRRTGPNIAVTIARGYTPTSTSGPTAYRPRGSGCQRSSRSQFDARSERVLYDPLRSIIENVIRCARSKPG